MGAGLPCSPRPDPLALRSTSMTNIIASSPDDYVSIVSLTPSAGFTLSDGLVAPSPILMIDGNCFLWDVSHPTEGFKTDGTPKNELGMDWDGWSKEKLAVFETLSPRPGAHASGRGDSIIPHRDCNLCRTLSRRNDLVRHGSQGAVCPSGRAIVPERARNPGRRPRLGELPAACRERRSVLPRVREEKDAPLTPLHSQRNASATFNLLQEEGRRVAAALYPVSHLSARTGLVA